MYYKISILADKGDVVATHNQPRPGHPGPAYFLDLRLITGLICMTWPEGRYLAAPGLAGAVEEHVSQQREHARHGRQQGRRVREPALHGASPLEARACAGLLTAASQLLAIDDPPTAAGHLQQPLIARAFQMAPWHRYFIQAQATCSPLLGTEIASEMSELRPPAGEAPTSPQQQIHARADGGRTAAADSRCLRSAATAGSITGTSRSICPPAGSNATSAASPASTSAPCAARPSSGSPR